MIKTYSVLFFPLVNSSGAGWDVLAGPDIYVAVNAGTSPSNTSFTTSWSTDCVSTNYYDYTSSVNITNLNNPITVSIWDHDSPDTDDFMGGIYFTPSSQINGLPSTIRLYTGGNIDIYLNVTWNF